jgi:membrane fusion protein
LGRLRGSGAARVASLVHPGGDAGLPRPGLVGTLKVKEGSVVRQGDPLVEISDEVLSSALGATQAQIMRRLDERRDSLRAQQQQQRQLLAQQQATLARRISGLDAEHEQSRKEIALLNARANIAARSEALHRMQFDQGFISENRMALVEAEKLEQRARVASLERNLLINRRERHAVEDELRELPLKLSKDIAGLERDLAQLEQERAEAAARRAIVVPAPMDGTVTAIQAVAGASADTTVPMLSIVPLDTRLDVHLYAPSRAVGFVQPGQRVQVRHQAYPYQKFGHQQGEVQSVSRSAVSPTELPRALAGLPGLAATSSAAEPVYRVTVRLAEQMTPSALPLRAGMLVESDVALEKRRLVDWVLEPLHTVTGRWTP